MRAEFKFVRLFSVFILFMFEAALFSFASNRRKAHLVSKYAAHLLKILCIRCHYQNTWGSVYPGLIVSNHISYVDILVIAKLNPALFITSKEVRDSIGIGWLARLAGCIFVERRNREQLSKETAEIEKVLQSHTSVVLFPEGTSTRGDVVLNFHAALFQSAIHSRSKIHNFYIQYDHPTVAYCGEDRFIHHLYQLCKQESISANLKYLGETKYTIQDDRKSIARMSYEKIIHVHASRTRRNQPHDRCVGPLWESQGYR